jgi:FAD synthase
MMNIGTNPTVGKVQSKTIETYFFPLDQDLYKVRDRITGQEFETKKRIFDSIYRFFKKESDETRRSFTAVYQR